MRRSMLGFKRVQPLLGTYLQISFLPCVDLTEADLQSLCSHVFLEARRLEKIFSRFQTDSQISVFNQMPLHQDFPVAPEFAQLLGEALKLWKLSTGAFNPFFPERLDPAQDYCSFSNDQSLVRKNFALHLDLNGIAKGFIVDRCVDFILQKNPDARGLINAGGDLRFFNHPERRVHLRLGKASSPLKRELILPSDALASTSLSISLSDPNSNSRYHPILRCGLSSEHTVSVLAATCAIADGLSKVALYASLAQIEECAKRHAAQVLVFDPSGSLQERFGA